MFTLIGLGVGVAYAYSVYGAVFEHGVDVYFESAAMIVTLVLLRAGPGTQGSQPDGSRHQGAAGAGTENRASDPARTEREADVPT